MDAAAHHNAPPIPLRLAAIALVGTWWTHLFGGSAGREGSAVQMGAAVADAVVAVARRVFGDARVGVSLRQGLVVAGIAGGFGGVFGTPVAGAIFAIEVVVARRIDTSRAVFAVVGAVVGDLVGHAVLEALGGAHGHYPTLSTVPVSVTSLLSFAVLGVAVGVCARAFMTLTERIKALSSRARPWQRGVVGGAIVVVIWWVIPGAEPLVGLSLPTLEAAARGDVTAILPWTFALKLLLTAVTLGVGLIGGEVTPLFVIGATLGVVVAGPLGLPPEQAACAALAAMFGACAGAPLALLAMIVELCGSGAFVQQLVCIVTATAVVGGQSIYRRRDVGAAP
jgi:H+/Cl- antiporter ClcA